MKSFFLITVRAGTVKSSSGISGCMPSTRDGTVDRMATESAVIDRCKPRMRSMPKIHEWRESPATTYTGCTTSVPKT